MKDKIVDWMINSPNKGISSKAMATAFLDKEPDSAWAAFGNHPSDPSDFNRCLLLLQTVPEAREEMHKVAALSKVWKTLIENWDKLESCFIEEVGLDWEKDSNLNATKTYEMMKSFGC